MRSGLTSWGLVHIAAADVSQASVGCSDAVGHKEAPTAYCNENKLILSGLS